MMSVVSGLRRLSNRFAAAAVSAVVVLVGSLGMSAPAAAAVPYGVWSCSGIPAGAVSLEMKYNMSGCSPSIPANRVTSVSSWASGDSAWVCGWGLNGLNGTVSDDFRSSYYLCRDAYGGFLPAWHIVKL
jgi:hypothetical protein